MTKHKVIKKWNNKKFDTIIDVRSPLEFAEDHIVGAINCPVLSDLERQKVGTIYKKESSFKAKIIGSSLTAKNIAFHIENNFMEKKRVVATFNLLLERRAKIQSFFNSTFRSWLENKPT